MKKILGTGLVLALLAGTAAAADLPVYKARKADPLWDVAIGGWVASDYNFRGISQSNRHASGGAYFELQLNNIAGGQLYVGTAVSAIDIQTGSEVDFYAGWRKTWGKLGIDVGYIYYWYPAEKAVASLGLGGLDTDFMEVYAKASYAVNSDLTLGLSVFYSPDVLHAGGQLLNAQGLYTEASAKYVLPLSTPTAYGPLGAFVSGAVGFWDINNAVPVYGVNVSYTYWNAGVAFTLSALTLDLRYHDTDLTPAECAAFVFGGAATTRWCSGTFIAKLSFDTLLSKIKN